MTEDLEEMYWRNDDHPLDIVGYRVIDQIPVEAAPEKPPALSAADILEVAAKHQRDRAAIYDKPEGERSMAATVAAFNIIAGRGDTDAIARLTIMFSALRINLQENFPLDRDMLIERVQAAEHFIGLLTSPALSESEGWLLMQILKDVRDRQRPTPHQDSLEDCTSYSALKAEARLREA